MPCANHPEVENGLEYCCRCGTRLCPDCLVTLEGNRFCLGCKEEQVRDLLSGSAPSGLELASLGSRALALLIDGFILFTPQILLWGVLIGGMVLAEELLPADEATQMLVMIPMYLFLFVFAMISGMLPRVAMPMPPQAVQSATNALVPGRRCCIAEVSLHSRSLAAL